MLSQADLLERARELVRAYHLGQGNGKSYADQKAVDCYYGNAWYSQAEWLEKLGHKLVLKPSEGANQITAIALLEELERLGASVKTTLEMLEKDANPPRKLISQWRFASNALNGADYKRGLIPQLREVGPGAY